MDARCHAHGRSIRMWRQRKYGLRLISRFLPNHPAKNPPRHTDCKDNLRAGSKNAIWYSMRSGL
jgi:hypothetical protein